eukprot:CAMPEP_0119073326 /NCGR_PEP_ID=MMETSP1178-20130426/64205_1 /TAXON_ID=33656 /ORGANISM="unid sp, Strain CCMP2000" /LENGTH=270 /DNA_ID=CAMNT_0007055393 /DNA_START=245 /DNA_END=1054 /DNA_ORIENTATION=+
MILSIALRGALQLMLSFIFSAFLYRALYHALVPQTELTFPLHFGLCEQRADLAEPRRERLARMQFSDSQWHAVPAPSGGYYYSVHLCMTLPESPSNEAAGMFDVTLLLLGGGGSGGGSEAELAASPLLHSSRSMMLHFKSPLLRLLWTCFYALPMLVGLMEEKQQHCVEMHPRFFNPRSGVALARVSLSDCGVQVYEAALQFRLHFDRLGYVMHTWYFFSAAVGIGALMFVQLLAVLAFVLRAAMQAGQPPSAPAAAGHHNQGGGAAHGG